jgi:hypothetical protein
METVRLVWSGPYRFEDLELLGQSIDPEAVIFTVLEAKPQDAQGRVLSGLRIILLDSCREEGYSARLADLRARNLFGPWMGSPATALFFSVARLEGQGRSQASRELIDDLVRALSYRLAPLLKTLPAYQGRDLEILNFGDADPLPSTVLAKQNPVSG